MAETVGEALIEVMPDLGDFEDTLVGGVSSASEEAADAATDALGEITDAAEDAAEETVEAFEDAGSEIADQFDEAAEDADDALGDLTDSAEDAAEGSIEAFEDAGEEIVDQFEDASDDAADALGNIADAAEDAFDEVADAAEDAFDDVADAADGLGTSIADAADDASDAVGDITDSAGEVGVAFEGAAADVESAFDGAFAGIAADAGAAADDASAALSDIDVDIGDLTGAFDGLVAVGDEVGEEIADAIGSGAADAEESLESLSSVGSATLDEVNDAAGDAGDELAGAFGAGEAAALGSLGAVADAGGGIGAAIDNGSALATAAMLAIAVSTRQTASRMRDLGNTSEDVAEQVTESSEQAAEAIAQIEPPSFGEGGPSMPEPPDPSSFDGLQQGAQDVSEGLRVTFANGFEQVRVSARNMVSQVIQSLHNIAGSGEAPIVAAALSRVFSNAIESVQQDVLQLSPAFRTQFEAIESIITANLEEARVQGRQRLADLGEGGFEAARVFEQSMDQMVDAVPADLGAIFPEMLEDGLSEANAAAAEIEMIFAAWGDTAIESVQQGGLAISETLNDIMLDLARSVRESLTGIMSPLGEEAEVSSEQVTAALNAVQRSIDQGMEVAVARSMQTMEQWGVSTQSMAVELMDSFVDLRQSMSGIFAGAHDDIIVLGQSTDSVAQGLRMAFNESLDQVSNGFQVFAASAIANLHDIAGSGAASEVAAALVASFDRGGQEAQATLSRAVEQITDDLQSIGEEEPDEVVGRGFDVAAGEIAATFSQLRETAFEELTQFGVAGDEAAAVLKNTLLGALTSIMEALNSTAEEAESTARVLADNVPAAIEQISGEVETVRSGLESAFAGARDDVITSMVGMTDEAVAQLHRIAGSGAGNEVAEALRTALTEAVEALGPVFQALPDIVRSNFREVESGAMSTTEAVSDAFDQMGERVEVAFQDPRGQAIQALTEMGVGARDASRLAIEAFDGIGESVDSVVGPVQSVAEGIADVAGAETGAEVVLRLSEGMADLRGSIEPAIDDLAAFIATLEVAEQQSDAFTDQLADIDQRINEAFSALEEGGPYRELPEMFARSVAEHDEPLAQLQANIAETFDRIRIGAFESVVDLRDSTNEALESVGGEEAADSIIESFARIGGSISNNFEVAFQRATDLIAQFAGTSVAESSEIQEGFSVFAGELETEIVRATENAQAALGEIDADTQAARMRAVFAALSESVSSIFDEMVADAKETLGDMINPTPQHVADVIRTTMAQAVESVGQIFERLPDITREQFDLVESGAIDAGEAVNESFLQLGGQIASQMAQARSEAEESLTGIGLGAQDAQMLVGQAFDRMSESMRSSFEAARATAEALADIAGADVGGDAVERLRFGLVEMEQSLDPIVNFIHQIALEMEFLEGGDVFARLADEMDSAGNAAIMLSEMIPAIVQPGISDDIASLSVEIGRLHSEIRAAMDFETPDDALMALETAFDELREGAVANVATLRDLVREELEALEVPEAALGRVDQAMEQLIGDVTAMVDSARGQWSEAFAQGGESAVEMALAAERPITDLAGALEATIPAAVQVAIDAFDGMAVRTQSAIANAADNVNIESFGTLGERAAAAVTEPMEVLRQHFRQMFVDIGDDAVEQLRGGDFGAAADELEEHLSVEPSGFEDIRDTVLEQLAGMGVDAVDVTNAIHSAFRRLQEEIPGIFEDVRSDAQNELEGAAGDAEFAAERIADNMQSGMVNVTSVIDVAMGSAAQRIRGLVDVHQQATQQMTDDWEDLDPRTEVEQVFDAISETISAAFGGASQDAVSEVENAIQSMEGAFEGLDPEGAAERVEDAFSNIDLASPLQAAMSDAEQSLAREGITGDRVREALQSNIEEAGRHMGRTLESATEVAMTAVEEAVEEGGDPFEALVDAVGNAAEEFERSFETAAEAATHEIAELFDDTEDLAEVIEEAGEQVEESLGDDAVEAVEDLGEAVQDAAEEVEDALGDDAVEAAEDLGEAVQDAADDIQDALADDAVDAAEEFGESVEDAAEDAQDALEEVADSVDDFTDAIDDAADEVDDAADDMAESFLDFATAAAMSGEEVEDSVGDSMVNIGDIGSEVTDDLMQMFIESADAVGENFARAAEDVGDSLEEEVAGRGMAAFAEIEDSAEQAAANVDDAFDGIGGGIADSFDTAAGGAEGGGGRITAAMAGAAGGAAASSGKIAAILGSSAVKFGAWGAAAVAAGGAVVEAFAQSEQELNVIFANIDDALEDLGSGARDVAIDVANVTFPLDEVATLIDIARKRGLDTAEQLEDFANFWDMVGDASGESATKLAQMSPALQLVGVELGNEEEALDSFGFILRNTDASLTDFLGLIERAGQEFGDQGPSIEEMAGAVALLEDSGFRAERAQRILQRELRQTDGDLEAAIDEIASANSEDLPKFIEMVGGSGDAVAEQAQNFRDFRTPMQAIASVWDRLTTVFGGAAGTLSPLTELIEDIGDSTIEWATAFRDAVESSEGFTGGLEAVLEQMGLVHEIVDNPPAFHEVADEATAAFHEVADDSRGVFDLIFEALGSVISGLGSFIADNSDEIVSGILAVKSAVVAAAFALFEGIVDALPKLIPDLVSAVVDLIDTLSTVLVESTPAVIEGAVDLLTGLLEAVPIVLPMLIEGVLEIVLAIVQALADNVGPLIEAGVTALLALIDGIVQALPALMETISVDVIPALIDTIIELLPMIIEAGVDLIVALIDGIADAIPQLVDTVINDIIPATVKALNDSQPKIEQAAVDLGWALINGILSILDSLGQAIWDIADHIRRKFVEFLAPIIDDVIGWFRDLPRDAKVALLSKVFELVAAGRDMVRGIWDGIKSMGDWLKRQLKAWAADALPGPVAEVLGLKSPSTVFAEMGRNVVRGLTEGIEDEEDDVISEIERFANEMSSVDLALDSPSIGDVEGDIDRAAARRRRGGDRDGDRGGEHIEVTVHQQPSETPVESTMRALRRARYLSSAGAGRRAGRR